VQPEKKGRTPVAFHPKAWLMKRSTGRSSGLLLLNPSHGKATVDVCFSKRAAVLKLFQNRMHTIELTATGIAPDLHRLPF